MDTKTVTSTEFQTRAGQYYDEAAKVPIVIKRYSAVRVLVDEDVFDDYLRLKAMYDTRKALHPFELSDELKAELEKGYQGRETPELDHLLKE